VVHRDIKPGNLFMCEAGLLKVTDFGIAKAVSGTKLSVTGTFIGTLPYMAPEQWLGTPAAVSSDIWAAGCVLYELVSGHLPRSYSTPAEYLAAAARGDRVPALASVASVPPWLASAVMSMLQPDPRDRPTASACVQLLSGPSPRAAKLALVPGQPPDALPAPPSTYPFQWDPPATGEPPAGTGSPVRLSSPASRDVPQQAVPARAAQGRKRLLGISAASAAALIAVGAGVATWAYASSGSTATSSSPGGSSSQSSSADWARVTSAQAGGGFSALVAAARKEGRLNVITLPDNWANYGTIIKDFKAKYGIDVTDANPEGSSQDEINAITTEKGQSSAPDVVDVGASFAASGDKSGLWAPYEVQTWPAIPASAKQASGDYYADYGGYVAIGYDTTKVKVAPTSFRSLLNSAYKNQVAIDGNPAQAGSALAAVYAAAIANGGSLDNITPGVTYFKTLHKAGNFVPVQGTPGTVESGQTPILVWWDYLLASEVQAQDKNFKIVIPSDGTYAGYYYQAISRHAPDPAAARLWEEYLYSRDGQNLFLGGPARPIELSALQAAGTVNKAALAALPAVPAADGQLRLPTLSELIAAENIVVRQWPSVTS
jgi:putative spermidine/putrescine transport system substrate-binding protein